MSSTLNNHLEGAGTFGTAVSSKTFAFTVNAGTNTTMWVCVASDQTISGVTYNSVSMGSPVVTVALDGGTTAVYELKAPATGSNNVAVTLAGSGTLICQAVAFDSVGQTTSSQNYVQGYYGGASPISQAITSANGNTGLLFMVDRGSDTNTVFGGSGGSTLIGGTNQSNWVIASAYLASTGASVSPALTYSGGGANSPEYMGFDIVAAAGGATAASQGQDHRAQTFTFMGRR